MSNKQKLELTWVGKDKRAKLEPRILLEDKDKSYLAPFKMGDDDVFENMLIKGDNLLALMLEKLSLEVGNSQTLLLCCGSFDKNAKDYANITIKKIPKAILAKCEYDHDDYSLQIQNLPMFQPEEQDDKQLDLL